ncbi:hypothetical protein ACGC1H_005352 [Rhizoctonia solani]|uniref:Uncharacterized protein n=1 Tax=Rhizoctonia solani TaxID=456999 RepID=A0A8H2WW36_9AGAM|nr:unnamed protein product [Rhizoctonia solani]
MAVAFPYTPFPFNVTAISPSFYLSPISTTNVSLGWTPSCTTPECLPTASWSTSATNSTISFDYWGWDVAFDGNVKGNMSVELFNDQGQIVWNPSGDKLFSLRGEPDDYISRRNITLRVLDASPDSQLTLTRARVNGSSRGDYTWPADRWIVPSDDDRLSYTGFIPQSSVAQSGSLTTYTSSTAGDSVSMQFNGSAFLIYGPCGPTNGLMRVIIDGNQRTVNTSKPFASNDCLLFQSPGQQIHAIHQFVVENVDGRTLSIDRLEFFRLQLYKSGSVTGKRVVVISCTIVGVIVLCSVVIVIYVRRSVKRKMNPEEDRPRPRRRGFAWLRG